jgi:hypothetical protein
MKKVLKGKEYKPYEYKTKGAIIIDARTGCASPFSPRRKGCGSDARLSR